MKYYLVKTGADRFDLRQTRFEELFKTGREHPHDLMAVGFSKAGMDELIEKYFKGSVRPLEKTTTT